MFPVETEEDIQIAKRIDEIAQLKMRFLQLDPVRNSQIMFSVEQLVDDGESINEREATKEYIQKEIAKIAQLEMRIVALNREFFKTNTTHCSLVQPAPIRNSGQIMFAIETEEDIQIAKRVDDIAQLKMRFLQLAPVRNSRNMFSVEQLVDDGESINEREATKENIQKEIAEMVQLEIRIMALNREFFKTDLPLIHPTPILNSRKITFPVEHLVDGAELINKRDSQREIDVVEATKKDIHTPEKIDKKMATQLNMQILKLKERQIMKETQVGTAGRGQTVLRIDMGDVRRKLMVADEKGTAVDRFSYMALVYLLFYYMFAGLFTFRYIRYYGEHEQYTFVDAFYLTSYTVFTVGYGDITPTHISAIIISDAIAIFSFFVSFIFSRFVSRVARWLDQRFLARASYHTRVFYHIVSAIVTIVIVMSSGIAGIYIFERDRLARLSHRSSLRIFLDILHLTVMTMTTTGYGDVAFATVGGRAFATLWIPFCTTFYSVAITFLTETFLSALLSCGHRAERRYDFLLGR